MVAVGSRRDARRARRWRVCRLRCPDPRAPLAQDAGGLWGAGRRRPGNAGRREPVALRGWPSGLRPQSGAHPRVPWAQLPVGPPTRPARGGGHGIAAARTRAELPSRLGNEPVEQRGKVLLPRCLAAARRCRPHGERAVHVVSARPTRQDDQANLAETDRWEPLSVSTNFDDVTHQTENDGFLQTVFNVQ